MFIYSYKMQLETHVSCKISYRLLFKERNSWFGSSKFGSKVTSHLVKAYQNLLSNLSEWLYICNNSSTADLDPLTTLTAPVAIVPRSRWKQPSKFSESCQLYSNMWRNIQRLGASTDSIIYSQGSASLSRVTCQWIMDIAYIPHLWLKY